MNLWQLIERNIAQRKLSSILTALCVAMGMMLISAIFVLKDDLERHFVGPGTGYSLVVGAPGSRLQLVLNAIYHMDQSPGLLPMRVYDEVRAHPSTRLVVPYAVGDSFRGYRVVGTTDGLFHAAFPAPSGKTATDKLAAGRPFRYSDEALARAVEQMGAVDSQRHARDEVPGDEHDEIGHGEHDDEEHEEHGDEEHGEHDDDAVFEAVVGAEVAARLKLRVGDRIEPTHGVEGGGDAHDHEMLWTVVGILRPTGTPIDEVVFINLDSFYRIPDHRGGVLPGSDEVGISALLVFPKSGIHKALLLSGLNKRPDLQVADVGREIRHLLTIVGNIDALFLAVALLVLIIGLTSILVAIYNTMNERKRDIAILRAIGAKKRLIAALIVGEASVIAGIGGVIGLLLSRLLLFGMATYVESSAGFRPDIWRMLPVEMTSLVLIVVIGALAGLLPAWKSYRVDVANQLARR